MDGITTHNPIMDVPELIPMEDYDPYKARLQASIRWLLTKAFGNHIPTDLLDPFYDDRRGSPQLKPVLVNALTSADLYCRACSAIFRADTHTQWEGHWSVMQALSRKGVYVVDSTDSAVTESLLLQTQPFKMAAHLAMIESLMQAHVAEVVSVERVAQAVRKFATFNASAELPYTVDDSLVFWINKVCSTVQHRAQQDLVHDSREKVEIPVVEDLLKDVNDGCCLAALISFYCPDILPITEVAAKSNLAIADSLYNVQLVYDFCEKHLPCGQPMTVTDLFYTPPQLRLCLIAFLAELFGRFEVYRLPFVRDTSKPYVIQRDGASSPTQIKRRPQSGRPLISNVTKKSFQKTGSQGDLRQASASNPDLHNNSVPPPRQPLLPRRLGNRNHGDEQGQPPRRVMTNLGSLRRSHSLTSIEDHEGLRDSVRAWEDQNSQQDDVIDSQETGRSGSTLLANVSINSDMSLDLTPESSIDLSELEDTPRVVGVVGGQSGRGGHAGVPVGPVSRVRNSAQVRHNPNPAPLDDMRLESVTSRSTTSGHSTASPRRRGNNPHGNPHGDGTRPTAAASHNNNNSSSGHNGQAAAAAAAAPLEPLLPAKLKPAKEKTSNHTKEVESGEKPEKKSPASPNSKPPPRTLTLAKANGGGGGGGGEDDTSSDEEFQTPSAENVPFFEKPKAPAGAADCTDVPAAGGCGASSDEHRRAAQGKGVVGASGRQYEAFFVDTDNPPISATANGVLSSSSGGGAGASAPPGGGVLRTIDRHKPQAQSFTLHDTVHTPESARAAGIPVVDGPAVHRPIPRRPASSARDSAGSSSAAGGGKAGQRQALSSSSHDSSVDQELSKLNSDSRNKELQDAPKDTFFLNPSTTESVQRPDTLNVPKPIHVDPPGESAASSYNGDRPSPKTSFAEIKKQKDSGEVSPVTYLQHGSPLKTSTTSEKQSLKSAFHKTTPGANPHGKHPKKTSFAALPNQTTWQESAHKTSSSSGGSSSSAGGSGAAQDSGSDNRAADERSDAVQPMPTELVSIRMRLEERRRQIETEKRRMEMHWNKQRQRVGKQAFIAVITKGKGSEGSPEDMMTTSGTMPRKTPDSATDSGLGGSQTEGEPDLAIGRAEQEQQEARRREAERERQEKQKAERERQEMEERQRKEEEERKRELEERLRKAKEEQDRKEQEEREEQRRRAKEEEERKARAELERKQAEEEKELERLRELERERLKKELEEREKERQRELEKELELELERERKRQREIEKELERELELEREKTRRAERDLELERLREKHSQLERQLEQQLRERSESPAAGSESGGPKRTFSREGIQTLLDSGKQRWLSREGTPTEARSARPKSYAAGEADIAAADHHLDQQAAFTSSGPTLSSLSGLAGAKAEYGQGLDKLNTSLSDLQGEIMRLSLEQDHIKTMVIEPRPRLQATPPKQQPSGPSPGSQSSQTSRYYGMYPEPSGEPDLAGGLRSSHPGSTAAGGGGGGGGGGYNQSAPLASHPGSLYGSGQSGQFQPTHPGVYGVQQYLPPPPTTGQYGQYLPYQQQYPQGVPQPAYQPPPHQGATTPLYHAPPGAPLYQPGYGPPQPGGHQGPWPPPPLQHPYGPVVTSTPPAGQPYPQPGQPRADYNSPAATQTHTTSAHQRQQMSPSASTPYGLAAATSGGGSPHADIADSHGPHGDAGSYTSAGSAGGADVDGGSPRPDVPVGASSPVPQQLASPLSQPPPPHLHQRVADSSAAAPGPLHSPAGAAPPPPAPPPDVDGDAEDEDGEKGGQTLENEGFFISFDSDSPKRRQKPKLLGQNRKKRGAAGNSGGETAAAAAVVAVVPAPLSEPPPPEPPAPAVPTMEMAAGQPSTSPPKAVVRVPGVGFVIGQEEDEGAAQMELSSMEKRKQKILQQQLKRREEQEKKRQKAEQARALKDQQKRLKQEEAEMKKAEEKARREAIFAQYLLRKADTDNTDEDAKQGPQPPVKKRDRTKPKGPRPKSQPPAPYSGREGSAPLPPAPAGPGGHGDDHNSASSHSHSSQEDLCARGGTYAGGGTGGTSGGTNQMDLGYQLAYGGLTHRRPPSPVWKKPHRPGLLMRRVLPGNRMHAESLPSRLDKSGQVAGQGEGGTDGGANATTEYHGPKLFVKPSQKSNRHIIGNAISHCCLAGAVNNDIKNKVLDEVQRSESKHFIILFRNSGQQYRSIYTYNPDREEVLKLHGTGPKQLNNKMMERFYKYNSGCKSFSEVTSTKHLSVSIDAVTIQDHYWQKKPPVRKGGPNMY